MRNPLRFNIFLLSATINLLMSLTAFGISIDDIETKHSLIEFKNQPRSLIYYSALDSPRLISQVEELFDFEDFDFWSEQCLLLSAEDDHQKTLDTCQRAITLRPRKDNIELWRVRGVALFNLERYVEAIVSFQQVLRNRGKDSISLAYQCAAYRELQHYNEAVDNCETALRINGNWGNQSPGFAWYNQALALQALGRLETALNAFELAVSNQPENIVYRANKCAIEVELGRAFTTESDCDLRRAIATYERALAFEPENIELWLQQGLALEQQGDYERALVSYEQALDLEATHSLTLARQCGVLNQLEKYEEALAACDAAFKGDNQWGRIGSAYGWTQRGRAQIGLGDYASALSSARRAIDLPTTLAYLEFAEISPEISSFDNQLTPYSYPPAWNNLAVAYWHLQNYSAAQISIERALRLYENSIPQLSYTFQQRYPESPVFMFRGYVSSHYNHGHILMSQQSYELAARAYQEAIDLASFANAMPLISSEMIISSSFLSKIYAHQAIAYLNLGNFKAGVSSAQNAVIKNPKSFIANYNLALLLLSNRQHQQALEIFTIANRLQSKDSDSEEAQNIYILTGQGLSLAGLGRTQEALNLLNQVINLAPSYLPARNAQR